MGTGNFSHHRVQTGSGAYLASYPMGTRGRVMKLTTSIYSRSQRMRGSIPQLSNTPSWLGAQLKEKYRDNFTFTFTTSNSLHIVSSSRSGEFYLLSVLWWNGPEVQGQIHFLLLAVIRVYVYPLQPSYKILPLSHLSIFILFPIA
jgi:hypothetical protein